MIRTRFAPSPTGDPHLGVLRNAVFEYLLARSDQDPKSSFILRIEDTDQAREKEGSLEMILKSMEWLGISPDEGVCLDGTGTIIEKGDYGPYTQSKRLEIYKKYANQLLAEGHAYRCFCTPERLQEMREAQQAAKELPHYDRHCRAISKEESDAGAANGEKFVVRQLIPDNQEVVLHDAIRGDVIFNSKDLDDHVLLKSDGFPTYHLANVVDDHLMEMTHVIRSEEWLPSSPRHLLLYQAFGWEAPVFGHSPVVLGPDGKHKLAKRDGAEAVLIYRDRGYLPQAILNVLAFLGWSPGTEEEFFSKDELAKRFSLNRVQKSPANFNFDRLDYVNGWYIRHLPVGEVADHMVPFLKAANFLTENSELTEAISHPYDTTSEYILAVAGVVQERLKHFDESAEVTKFFFHTPMVDVSLCELVVPKKSTWESTMAVLREATELLESFPASRWNHDNLQEELFQFVERKGLKNGDVLWPIRAALTGVAASPGAFEMLAILGREESLKRLKAVIG